MMAISGDISQARFEWLTIVSDFDTFGRCFRLSDFWYAEVDEIEKLSGENI